GRLTRARLGQPQRDLRLADEARRYHEEDEEQEDDVDQRRQVHLGLFSCAAFELHGFLFNREGTARTAAMLAGPGPASRGVYSAERSARSAESRQWDARHSRPSSR